MPEPDLPSISAALGEAVRDALEAATKGPWDWQAGLMAEGSERTYAGYPQRVVGRNPDPTDTSPVLIAETFDGHEDQVPPHAHLIANAPTWLAQLLGALEAAEAERDEWQVRAEVAEEIAADAVRAAEVIEAVRPNVGECVNFSPESPYNCYEVDPQPYLTMPCLACALVIYDGAVNRA